MIYSYTQISHYLACPRKYRYRYLDGRQEKETRASLLFGRAFEQALAAYFLRQDPTEVLFNEWSAHQHTAGLQAGRYLGWHVPPGNGWYASGRW